MEKRHGEKKKRERETKPKGPKTGTLFSHVVSLHAASSLLSWVCRWSEEKKVILRMEYGVLFIHSPSTTYRVVVYRVLCRPPSLCLDKEERRKKRLRYEAQKDEESGSAWHDGIGKNKKRV